MSEYPKRGKRDAHRVAAEIKLGRKLRSDEDVDHRNQNKKDSNPANLDVMPHGKHSSLTGSRERKTLAKLQEALRMPAERKKLY